MFSMAKRVAKRVAKKAKLDEFSDLPVGEDRLSALPDDILIHHILASLPFGDVAKTSILSRRWRHLYLQTSVMALEFYPDPNMFDKVENPRRRRLIDSQEPPSEATLRSREAARRSRQHRFTLAEMKKYAKRVTGAISTFSNRSETNGSLVRFSLHLPEAFLRYLDSWLKFPLGDKGVEHLELIGFSSPYRTYRSHRSIKSSLPTPWFNPGLFPKLHLLKSLTLCRILIYSKAIEELLLKCVFLERLRLKCLVSLSEHEVRITGPVSRLKYIYIDNYYHNPMSIVVSGPTPDLVSLRYPAFVKISSIEFAPRLTDLSIASYCERELDLPSHKHFRYVSQLQALHLDICHWKMVKQWLPRLPDLSGLKRLTLTIKPGNGTAMRVFRLMIPLINAANCLQHLTLMVSNRPTPGISEESEECADLHVPSLRVIEIERFCGTPRERELVEYVVKAVTASLGRLIVDSRTSDNRYRAAQSEIETWRTSVLEPILPAEAKLILLYASKYDDMINFIP